MRWRNHFLEQSMDYELPPLFQVGVQQLSEQSKIKQLYNVHFNRQYMKMCFVYRYADGFDLFSTSSLKHLYIAQQNHVYRKFRELADDLHTRLQQPPQLA